MYCHRKRRKVQHRFVNFGKQMSQVSTINMYGGEKNMNFSRQNQFSGVGDINSSGTADL